MDGIVIQSQQKFTDKYLNEANFLGVATEALSAAHKPVLPDYTMGVATDTAITSNDQIINQGHEN